MKWHLYGPCDEAKIVAHDDGALWFLMGPYAGGQVLWRYDLKTQRLAATSMLDDLPNGKEPSALNPGKGFCPAGPLTFRNRTWVQGDGWSSIPVIKGLFGPILALAQDGQLFGAVGTPHGERTLMKWDGRWKKVGTLPEFAHGTPFAVLDGGYMLLGLGGWDSGQLAWIGADGETRKDWYLPKERHYPDRQLTRVGDKVYATYLTGWNPTEEILYELTCDGPKEKARGDVVGVDLSGRGFLKATVERKLGYCRQWKIESIPAGETVITPPLPGAHKG
ncbi:MAG TPA: hypothetical protein VFJ30_17570, partial [Phycisphaerae bacterium]|nr:hypothetical protein [Phycisphaerae bacterium]